MATSACPLAHPATLLLGQVELFLIGYSWRISLTTHQRTVALSMLFRRRRMVAPATYVLSTTTGTIRDDVNRNFALIFRASLSLLVLSAVQAVGSRARPLLCGAICNVSAARWCLNSNFSHNEEDFPLLQHWSTATVLSIHCYWTRRNFTELLNH